MASFTTPNLCFSAFRVPALSAITEKCPSLEALGDGMLHYFNHRKFKIFGIATKKNIYIYIYIAPAITLPSQTEHQASPFLLQKIFQDHPKLRYSQPQQRCIRLSTLSQALSSFKKTKSMHQVSPALSSFEKKSKHQMSQALSSFEKNQSTKCHRH